MRVFAIICHNGLGHFKRCISVLSEMLKQLPQLQLTVACEQWQIDRMKDWEVSASIFNKPNVQVLSGLVEPGVYWAKSPNSYNSGNLVQWHKRLEYVKELKDADLILSDNLTQVLHYRKDAILMGSFLWSDILDDAYKDVPAVQAFVAEERELLATYKPYMICVGDVVMPGVIAQTNAIALPWFCAESKKNSATDSKVVNKYKIALLGGATASIAEELKMLAQALAKSGKVELFLPKQLYAKFGEALTNTSEFDHSTSSFAALDLVVCRPGIGTLTDSICFELPIVSVYEAGNIEMTHNGYIVEQLEIGINIGVIGSAYKSAVEIISFLESATYNKAKEKIRTRPIGGVEASVSWLVNHLKQSV